MNKPVWWRGWLWLDIGLTLAWVGIALLAIWAC